VRTKSALLAVAISLSLATIQAQTQSKAAGGFDRLKTLVGEWQATDETGKPFTSSFRLLSDDTALEETLESDKNDQMVTLYTPDGNRVALTHYCSMGNQPRMATPAVTGTSDEFVFAFTGATNLTGPEDMHMHRMVLQIDDAEHFSETWTMRGKGHDTKETFNFTRKK
jgi:hypothetical protein